MQLDFLLTSLVVIASPGTGVVYTLAAGLARGRRASVVAALGCSLGILPHMLAAITGLASLLHASALAFHTVKYLGVAYLLYMAFNLLRERGTLRIDTDATPRSARQVILSGLWLNLFNPKLSIFFIAFLPQFVRADDPAPLTHMAELSLVFMLLSFAVFAVYGVAAAALRGRVLSRPALLGHLHKSFAAAFLALGAKLAFTER